MNADRKRIGRPARRDEISELAELDGQERQTQHAGHHRDLDQMIAHLGRDARMPQAKLDSKRQTVSIATFLD